jgi:hypothetical protein
MLFRLIRIVERKGQAGWIEKRKNDDYRLFQATEDKFVIDETGPTSLIIIDDTEEVHEVVYCYEAGELL